MEKLMKKCTNSLGIAGWKWNREHDFMHAQYENGLGHIVGICGKTYAITIDNGERYPTIEKACKSILRKEGLHYENGQWRGLIGSFNEELTRHERELNLMGGRPFGRNCFEAVKELHERM